MDERRQLITDKRNNNNDRQTVRSRAFSSDPSLERCKNYANFKINTTRTMSGNRGARVFPQEKETVYSVRPKVLIMTTKE